MAPNHLNNKNCSPSVSAENVFSWFASSLCGPAQHVHLNFPRWPTLVISHSARRLYFEMTHFKITFMDFGSVLQILKLHGFKRHNKKSNN